MCLSIAINRPGDVLAKGEHAGFEWVVTNNGMGYRCGYVKVTPGHPWYGKGYDDVPAECHGGLTFADADVACDRGGSDDGWWLGFDCAHGYDLPDPALPGCRERLPMFGAEAVRDQAYAEAECRSLCEQAKAAA
jgi:hypothetical protein